MLARIGLKAVARAAAKTNTRPEVRATRIARTKSSLKGAIDRSERRRISERTSQNLRPKIIAR